MHFFISTFDVRSAERALNEASRIARPGDLVTVMAAVIVPGGLPVAIGAGEIWKQVCQAERRLFHARQDAGRILPTSVMFRFVRVQARDRATAIRAGATQCRAELILLDAPQGFCGALSLRFGTIAAVLRNAPCAVRFVETMTAEASDAQTTEPISVAPLSTLQVIAVNPALAGPCIEDRIEKTEGHHAS